MITPRYYQRDCVDAIWNHLRTQSGNPCAVLPTGAGKSPIIGILCQELLQTVPSARVIVLAHIKELLTQNAATMKALWPAADVGVYSSGLRRKELNHAITFAGIQSVHRNPLAMGRIDLLIVDEAHRIPTKGDGMYRTFLEAIQKNSPHARLVGLTATPNRLGVGPVVGPGKLLTDTVYEIGVKQLIDEGYLSNLTSRVGDSAPNFDGIAIRNGEYDQQATASRFMAAGAAEAAIAEIQDKAGDRKKRLHFTSSVAHAELVAEALGCPFITGETPAVERDQIVAEFKAGQYRDLVNVTVFTEGFDVPDVDCVTLLFRTNSPTKYCQVVGRGLRKALGKDDCLILDFGRNIERHGPVDDLQMSAPPVKRKKAETGMPTKTCPECGLLLEIRIMECSCGHKFPQQAPHEEAASELDILKRGAADRVQIPITNVYYFQHDKPGKPPTFRVDYMSGLSLVAREWVALESVGIPRAKAVLWWQEHQAAGADVPPTVQEALKQTTFLRQPRAVILEKQGAYNKVVSRVF